MPVSDDSVEKKLREGGRKEGRKERREGWRNGGKGDLEDIMLSRLSHSQKDSY